MNDIVSEMPKREIACAIRFSIGAILFERKLWTEMGFFDIYNYEEYWAKDEIQFIIFCILHSKPIMVSENIVVGHLSYHPQKKVMKDYYMSHKEIFSLPKANKWIHL